MSAEPSKGRINLESAHVLMVESSPQGMEILEQMVNGLGVRGATKCASIEAAWTLLKMADFDLILCAAPLSDGDGYDFIAELRGSTVEPNRFSSVILLSGHTPAHQIHKARDCGANFVIAKPLSGSVLLDRIVWIAREQRAFIECAAYTGPDRRFQNVGPPSDMAGRRKEDSLLMDDALLTASLQDEAAS